MNKTKKSLIFSAVSLLLCLAMLAGSTFAWFTDSVTSAKNKIVAGDLDVELEYLNAKGEWESVEGKSDLFDEKALWEPGHTEVVYLRVVNIGTLALKYRLGLNIADEIGSVNVLDKEFKLSDFIKFGAVNDIEIPYADRETARDAVTDVKLIREGYTKENAIKAGDPAQYVALVVYMPEDVGNEANYKTGCAVPKIELGVTLVATQMADESDDFDNTYDEKAEFPEMKDFDIVVNVPVSNGVTTKEITAIGEGYSVIVPVGVKTKDDSGKLGVTVKEKATSDTNLTLNAGESIRPMDVHVDGVADDNTVPIVINLGEVAPKGLNIGNYTLYHVENDQNVAMSAASSAAELDAHNEFYYDPATGEITVAMASFSEVAVVAETDAAWKGSVDHTWYQGKSSPYMIANADQLWSFSQIVGGMAEGIEQDSFTGKVVKLVANINLGDKESENNTDVIFYPIGYHNSTGSYEKVSGGSVTSNVSSFEGTFDGNGNTISNFYQNTWEMFGDYNNGYSGTPNHYKDAMGLFGYVVGGKICNLTVDNFSSDGEFTPTGVIAAYAVNSTFENIAITNCNPRVYNTGNGGIVGIGGNSDDPDAYKLTFTNVTIDNSNKITALWGSWDVACGGLVGMFRGDGRAHMTNCHVAAQIDVYNDVCGNYQYYWYRYSGMMIGTNQNMTTDANGYTVPETEKFHAENCTVHFGDWNDYYYCELVANSLASYTHDHQFSRLEQIQNVSEIQDANGNWTKTGNFILMNGKTPTETCYHIMKDTNGNLYEHKHDVADATNPVINEVVNGETVLKENNQRIFLPFNQLFTGYGWGVKHIPVYNGENYAFDGITILDREVANSVEKFEGKVTELANNKKYKLGDLFNVVDNGVALVPGALTVTVTNLDENNPVSATIEYDRTANGSWENGTIILTGAGKVQITIQDYYFCTPTTIEVNITERASVEKFETKFTGDFLYRVGNQNAVKLDSLFKAKDGASIGTVSVSVEPLNGTAASGTYTPNATWTNGTIQFSGTGVVKVTITDNDYCTPTELILEVVDAKNATTATSATANNVVLLNDCGFSSLTVSDGYTLYGNGFTMTCGSDSASLSFGQFVELNNGTLDNVQIVCPNYDYAALYNSQLKDTDANRSETTNGTTRYFNAKSAVLATGNSQILNSRISGGRAALYASNGNIVVDNSRLEGGAVATVIISAANSFVFRDTTLIQKPTVSTYDSNKTLMGMSVLYLCDADGNATPTTLEGSFVQYAWADSSCAAYMPTGTDSIVTTVLGKSNYKHTVNGKECVNLGFAYMPNEGTTVNQPGNIIDNRDNKDTIPYAYESVSASVPQGGFNINISTYVYSYKNTNGTEDSFKTEAEYNPNKYSDIIAVSYSDTSNGLTTGKSYGTNGWIYELNVDLDTASGYTLDFSKLAMTVNGVTVTDYTVNGAAKPSTVAVIAGGTEYTLTATVDGKEYVATYIVTGVETSKRAPYLVDQNGNEITVDDVAWGVGVCVTNGSDYSGAAPVLQGVYIKYWSVADGDYKQIALSSLTPTESGKQNDTNSWWEYSDFNNDFALKITNTSPIHSGKSVYGMPVVYNEILYFTISSTDGMVSSSSGARSIKMEYVFKDNNGGELIFEHTWSVGYSSNNTIKYSDMVPSDSGSTECVTPDTLITLADGTQVRVDSLTGNEELLVWNMATGKLDKAPIMFVDSEVEAEYEIVKLIFSDGTEVKVIGEHGFWDYDLNKYVYLDMNAAGYIGHTFAKQNGDTLEKVRLVDIVIENEVTTAWSPVTVGHLCYFVNGMLSMPGGVGGLFNIFDVDAKTMTYDLEAMQRDIETYGLFTYEELNAICHLSEEMFNAAGGAYLKISIGKGNLSEEELIYMINRYSKFFE